MPKRKEIGGVFFEAAVAQAIDYRSKSPSAACSLLTCVLLEVPSFHSVLMGSWMFLMLSLKTVVMYRTSFTVLVEQTMFFWLQLQSVVVML